MGLLDLFRKRREDERAAATFATYAQHSITPAEISRRYTLSRPKTAELMARYRACSTVSYCADLNAMVLAHYPMRMYKRGKAGAPFKGIKQQRVTSTRTLKDLHNPVVSGKAADYARDAKDDVYEVVEHPFLTLCANPNEFDTRISFWGCSWMLRQVCGYAPMLVTRTASGKPKELFLLYPQFINPILSDETFIDGWTYYRHGDEPARFDREDVRNISWMKSGNAPWDSKGWVENIVPEADQLIGMNAAEQALYENACRFEGIFTLPEETTPSQADEFAERVNAKHRGVQNAGKFLVVRGPNDFKQASWSPREMQTGVTEDRLARRIRNAAFVPESFSNLSQSNLAGAVSGNSQYSGTLVQPQLVNQAEQLTAMLCDLYGHEPGEYWIGYDNIIETNADELARIARSKFESNGLTLNEYRAELNMDPIGDERGDLFYAELVARGNSLYGPVASQPGQPDIGTQRGQTRTDQPERTPDAETTKAIKDTADAIKDMGRKDVPPPPPDMETAIREWLVRGSETRVYDVQSLAASIEPFIAERFRLGGADMLARIPGAAVSFDVLPQDALDFLRGYTIRLANDVAANQLQAINEAVQAGLEQGLTPGEAQARVHEAMPDRSAYDAERISRTESSRAYNQGAVVSARSAGVTKKRWQKSAGACPICDAIAAKYPDPIPIDQPFFKKGEAIATSDGPFVFGYEQIDVPPGHPNCRCTWLPILEDSDGPDAAA